MIDWNVRTLWHNYRLPNTPVSNKVKCGVCFAKIASNAVSVPAQFVEQFLVQNYILYLFRNTVCPTYL